MQPVRLGVLTGAHGIKGWLKLKSFTEIPNAILDYALLDAAGRPLTLLPKGQVKGHLLVAIPGVTTRNEAETRVGTELFVPREAIARPEAEDDYLFDDLVGLSVRLEDGNEYGQVKGVYNFGAGDIVEIAPAEGKAEMFSFTHANFPTVAIAEGYLVFSPPEILGEEKP